MQPVLDIGKLPEFHYLSYKDMKELVDELEDEMPPWLVTPDFFLPSKNIKHLMENNPSQLESNVIAVSNMIGVPSDTILEFVNDIKEKENEKKEQKNLMEKYKSNPLYRLTIADLKYLLYDYFGQQPHSGQKLKVDFLTAIIDEVQKRKLSDVTMKNILDEHFPQN